jgi:DNA-binding NarL/FixJ family response regulator
MRVKYKMLIVNDEKFKIGRGKIPHRQIQFIFNDRGGGQRRESERIHAGEPCKHLVYREMDGLQLAERVRELSLPVKVIFFSAFWEFEYAKRAIEVIAIR